MSNKTVYIVGAGASCEVNMPIGETLKKQISDLLVMNFSRSSFSGGNQELFYALQGLSENSIEDLQAYCKECRYISDNMHLAISIDNFIDSNRGNDKLALCGKIGIVEAILKAERKSTIYYDSRVGNSEMNYSKLDGTWYLHLFRTITENCALEDLEERFSNISMIVFNYDRCIEHVLLNTLAKYFRIPISEAVKLVQMIEIIHPYGTVGELPEFANGKPSIEYGGEFGHRRYVETAKNIYTFTEGGDSEDIKKLRNIMKSSDRLVFLGFAFHRLNMSLLMDSGEKPYPSLKSRKCIGTAYGSSDQDQELIAASVRALFKNGVDTYIENNTCEKLFMSNTRSLGYD